jgi:hypothetical protein
VRLPRSSRERLASKLTAAYAEGLLGDRTLSYRLGVLFGEPVIDPQRLVGDLSLRPDRWPLVRSPWTLIDTIRRRVGAPRRRDSQEPSLLLALDWSAGSHDDLLIGRDARACDVLLNDRTVSRRHARLRYRDGSWIIQDLRSTNGISLNGERVGRCRLQPGDELLLGAQRLEVD